MYNEYDIRKFCTNEPVFMRAKRLCAGGAVQNLRTEDGEKPEISYIESEVRGSRGNEYYVWIRYNEEKDVVEDYQCECEAFMTFPGMCKHCAALALEYLEQENGKQGITVYKGMVKPKTRIRTDAEVLDIVRAYAMRQRLLEQEAKGDVELIPELSYEEWDYFSEERRLFLSFKIGRKKGRKYVLKRLDEFAETVKNEESYSYGKQLSFVHSKSAFSPEGWKYAGLIIRALERRNARYAYDNKQLRLDGAALEEFFELNLNQVVDFSSTGRRYKLLRIYDKNPPVKLKLRETEEDGFRLRIPPLELIPGTDHLFVMIDNNVYRCTEEYRMAMCEILSYADPVREQAFGIASSDMPAFCAAVLPELEKQKTLDKAELSLEEYLPKEAEVSYYLDEEQGRVTLKAECSYGEKTYNLLEKPGLAGEYHDRERELRALSVAQAYFPGQNEGEGLLFFDSREEEQMYALLDTGLAQLAEEGTVYASDAIKAKHLIRSPRAQVGISLSGGLLEFSVDSESFSREELAGILESYRRKKKFFRLKNGDFLTMDQNAVTTVAEVLDGLGIGEKELEQERIQVPKFRACYLDQSLKKSAGQLQINRNQDYRALVRQMKNVADSDYTVPGNLSSVLREYQKEGYRWLRTLDELGFGGILADDMGLGKTIQTIAFLQAKKQERQEHRVSLIICPASLVYNWKREFARFAPGLQVRMITGTAQVRQELIETGGGEDVWITSYDMAKRDVELYQKLRFGTEIIDEAQNIKNQGTLAAKAVKRIPSDGRFALTGTPIENRLSELWSIFDYLMPGLLGSYDKFRREYEAPIVQEQDEERMERLKRMVSPFILRRMKEEVLRELPDKLEQVVYSSMDEEQRKLYTGHAARLLESLQEKSGAQIQKGKLQILAELTRLRQLCCDPALIYEDYKAGACKVDTCMELVKEAVGGKHKVLIFSQFTSIFPILEKRLKEENIDFYELTGQTSKEERMRLTEAFNSDDVPVFLISLKAGGTGLNLTAASIVIHFDPWWNVAAQNQATDRAHRIGQKQQVVVFKLIAQDTIEEKIIGLQEKKQKMSSQILEGEGISASMLSKEDFMEILRY